MCHTFKRHQATSNKKKKKRTHNNSGMMLQINHLQYKLPNNFAHSWTHGTRVLVPRLTNWAIMSCLKTNKLVLTWSTIPSNEISTGGCISRCVCIIREHRHIDGVARIGALSPPTLGGSWAPWVCVLPPCDWACCWLCRRERPGASEGGGGMIWGIDKENVFIFSNSVFLWRGLFQKKFYFT